jgi:prolyl-tRNA synthetase
MIRKLANGLFAYLPLGLRAFRKVERIVREEMDAIGALEIKPTVVVPGELWKESGRWETMGEAMLRTKNRTGSDFVVSPTAEEAVTALVRDELASYRQLPLTLYQINTKYRDEIRPRYGVMRAREFVMKDAYSFHADEAGLDAAYTAMGQAYRRIFKRCGLSVLAVNADSGAMGGSSSEEFMVESDIGDNTLILCESCGYAANVEKAVCGDDFDPPPSLAEAEARAASAPALEKVPTPGVKSVEDLCAFFKTDGAKCVKTLIYKGINAESGILSGREVFFAVAIRGDTAVNEAKLAAAIGASEAVLADEADVARITGAPVGFAGPVGLTGIPLIADRAVTAVHDGITGALAADFHYVHAAYGRDFVPCLIADLRTVKAGDRCARCGGALYEKKGNELGHIFKLGDKYTRSMKARYLDERGQSQIPLMGTYGIGLDRTLASIIEEHHDDDGIIWPLETAPYQILLIPVSYTGAVKEAADTLASALEREGLEVLVDDREERPGVKFKDADLLGIPYRVVVGDRALRLDPPQVEVKRRGEKECLMVEINQAPRFLSNLFT